MHSHKPHAARQRYHLPAFPKLILENNVSAWNVPCLSCHTRAPPSASSRVDAMSLCACCGQRSALYLAGQSAAPSRLEVPPPPASASSRVDAMSLCACCGQHSALYLAGQSAAPSRPEVPPPPGDGRQRMGGVDIRGMSACGCSKQSWL
jgi:hypothetical protein